MASDIITGEKSPIVAALLNICIFLLPVGYFYIGQWQKGLVALIIWFLLSWTFVFAVLLAIDAAMQANELKKGNAIGHWTFFTQTA